jgi:hypothetical protein
VHSLGPFGLFHSAVADFSATFRVYTVPGDGNCLFHALLVALGQPHGNHIALRKKCAQYIASLWQLLADQAQYTHRPPHNPTTPANLNDPSPPTHCFTFATDYYFWMTSSSPLPWGSDLEAYAAAVLHDRSTIANLVRHHTITLLSFEFLSTHSTIWGPSSFAFGYSL